MSKIIAGYFDDIEEVQAAVNDLSARGLTTHEYASYYVNPPGQHGLHRLGGDATSDEGAREAGRGAASGAALGGAVGLAAGSIGGPVGALAGAGVGAYVGSLAGALKKTREPRVEAASPEHPAEPEAGPMIAVCADRPGVEPLALAVLDEHGAREIDRAEGQWRDGWRDYDPRVPHETLKKRDGAIPSTPPRRQARRAAPGPDGSAAPRVVVAGSLDPAKPAADVPREYAGRVKTVLEALMGELREDLREFDEPRARVLFETAAEVVGGLHRAFDHYQRGTERAMRE